MAGDMKHRPTAAQSSAGIREVCGEFDMSGALRTVNIWAYGPVGARRHSPRWVNIFMPVKHLEECSHYVLQFPPMVAEPTPPHPHLKY